jgi:acyl carrier protein
MRARSDRRGAWRTANAAQIGTALRERLPDHMVPTALIARDTLPITAFGKIDRAAIAVLVADQGPSIESRSKLSRTPLETEIAAIWGDVLAREIVPGDVAFLEMGGNSLQAMQIVLHVRDRLGVDMSTADFFALPTVASQARFVETVLERSRS